MNWGDYELSMEFRKLAEGEVFFKNPCVPVSVETAGNIVKVQYMSKRNTKATIRMLPGMKEYIELSTGEIKECQQHETRADQIKSLRRTFETVRGIINANVVEPSFCKWITLTYSENMTDTVRLKTDFNKFDKRFQYYCKKQGYPKAEYITMVEPQGRGAWHHHLLYIFPCKAPYISNSELCDLWGHGFTKTKKLDNVDNVGAYLTAYLGDIEINNDTSSVLVDLHMDNVEIVEKDIISDDGIKQKKAFVKGARLPLYPVNFNMFRCSRGVKRPVIELVSQEMAKEKVSNATLTYSKTVELKDTDNDFTSIIHTEFYNLKRH